MSIPLALVNAAIAYGLWIAVFALVFTTDWLSWQQAISTTEETITLDGARRARVQVRHTAGRLHVTALDRDGAVLDGVFGGGLERAVSREGERADVELALPRHHGLLSPRYPWAWGHFSADWDLGISTRIPISLTINTMDGMADLDLEDVRLTDLDLQANASSVEIGLPTAAGQTTVRVHARAAVVVVRIPHGVAAWIRGERDMFELEVDVARFPMLVDHREYRSASYGESQNRVEVSVSPSASSVKIV